MRIFGDSLSCTTNNPFAGPSYYGQRYANGRVWVEVLASRQGLTFSNSWNNSFYGNYSTNILNTVKKSTAPADANTTLVVVWANNADLFDLANDAQSYQVNAAKNLAAWTNAINWSQTNHYAIITNLYARGFRTLVMPNVVDISTIPQCNHSSGNYTNVIRQQCSAYNVRFAETLWLATNRYPDLKFYSPDFHAVLTNLLAFPGRYGMTNPVYNYNGITNSVDAVSAFGGNPSITNCPGTNYIFWDPFNPTAKVHYIMANVAQEGITPTPPALIAQLTVSNGSNRLDLVKLPLGMNGWVEGCTNLLAGSWSVAGSFTATNPVQNVSVPYPGTSGQSVNVVPRVPLPPGGGSNVVNAEVTLLQFYRLRFPFDYWLYP